MIVRIFDTAMERDDIERAKGLFLQQVRPAFAGFDGCLGIEMYVGIDAHSLDLVDVAALSRWTSTEAITTATALPQYEDALAEIRLLFQQTPIVRHFEAME